ncbi:MAG: DUF2079 domain-containing protein [Chloroflexi bacterium]|nr:DUF2079 domain-containing protein [Chloroflexota bacterium]
MNIFQSYPVAFIFALISALAMYIIAPPVAQLDKLKSLQQWLTPRRVDKIFYLLALVALIGLPTHALHNYDSFNSYHDFADFDGILLGYLRGQTFSFSLYRFNPLLIALIPVYSVWANPKAILIVQSLGLAISALPLYWIGRKQIGPMLALIVAIAFWVSPSVLVINQAVFYEIKLAVPLLSFALFFLLRRRYVPFFISLGLALMLKQEIAFIAAGFALFIFFVQRQRLLGGFIFLAGIGLALLIILVLYPASAKGAIYPQFEQRYAYLGTTFDQVIKTLITRPDIALAHILVPTKIEFSIDLLTPLAFLPLIGWQVFAISLPAWAYTLLSDLPQQTDPTFYYQAPLLPFLFFGTIYGIRRLLDKSMRTQAALGVLLIISSQLYLPSTWANIFSPSNFVLDAHSQLGHQIITQIPSGSKVVAQPELFMPLSDARKFSVVEFSPNIDHRDAQSVFGDSTRAWYAFQKPTWENLRASGYFESVIETDGYFLLRAKTLPPGKKLDNGWIQYESAGHIQIDNGAALLGYSSAPNAFHRALDANYGDITLLGYSILTNSNVRGGDSVRVVVEWKANRDLGARYIMLAHLIDSRGHIWAEDDREPISGIIPTTSWRAGGIYRDQYTLALPRTMPPGEYAITIGVWNPQTGTRLIAQDAQEIILDRIAVSKDTTNIPADLLFIENPLRVDMREIRFLGSTQLPEQIAPGETLALGLYWRAREKPREDYQIAVQLVDRRGVIAFEQIDRPAAGAYATTRWQVGEVLLDWHDLVLPTSLPSENYDLIISLQKSADRLSVGETKIGQVIVRK